MSLSIRPRGKCRTCWDKTCRLLDRSYLWERVESFAEALLQRTTLTEDEIKEIGPT